MNPAQAFFAAAEEGDLVVAIPGKPVVKFPITTAQGTFLAKAASDSARALAAIMGCYDAYESQQVHNRGENGHGEDSG